MNWSFSLSVEPNVQNSQWIFNETGQIQVKSNPSLCMTSGTKVFGYIPVYTSACVEGSPDQSFTLINSTNDPTVTIALGESVVGIVGRVLVLFPPNFGAGIFPCNSSSLTQQIVFAQGGDSFGLLQTSTGHCLTGLCGSQSCYPAPFVTCNSSDPRQLWTFTFYKTFVNQATGDCLDAYNEVVCAFCVERFDLTGTRGWAISVR